ncbi:WecB/TagA/CpsF family glycosyltransferase [Adlercreutzia sp. ZJ176]|nr:WecB/TagA/CpsF family glycosyltransferase [Adlercreutzia sp. ZJ176]
MDQLIGYVTSHVGELRGNYICVSNVHTTVMAFEDEGYRAIQNGSAMSIPDGGPLSSVGRRRGFAGMERTTGPDLMLALFEGARQHPLRHYFYGSSQRTLDALSAALEADYPDVRVAGMFSPPFRELTPEEDAGHVEMMNAADPDVVWVGLGAPKQERWMAAHEGRVNALMVGVGAAFDYLAGNIRRAPAWMQRANLEWAYRLMQDPRRLAGRYASTNAKFVWHAMVRGE